MEFFFVLGFWAGNLVEVGRDLFPSYTGVMGLLRPKGTLFYITHLAYSIILI